MLQRRCARKCARTLSNTGPAAPSANLVRTENQSRWPIAVKHSAPVIMGIMLEFLATAPIADLLARRRLSRVSLWGGLAVLVSLPLRFAVAQTAA
jgi:hypothetical protein